MTSNVITTSNDTNTTYPPLHHREAEHLREELETIHNLLRVCVDSMQLVNVLELIHTTSVLDKLAERTWEAIEPARALENVLFREWTAKIEAKKAEEEIQARKQWRENLPTGAIEAFEAVNAVFRTNSKGEEA